MIVNSDTSSTMIVNCDSASLLANDLGTMIINDTDDESTMRSKHFVAVLSQLVVYVCCLIHLSDVAVYLLSPCLCLTDL